MTTKTKQQEIREGMIKDYCLDKAGVVINSWQGEPNWCLFERLIEEKENEPDSDK